MSIPSESPASRCPRCGGELTPDSLGGVCPACAFGDALAAPQPKAGADELSLDDIPRPGTQRVAPEETGEPSTEKAWSPHGRIRNKPGDRIGRYKLLEKIGEGGFGVVYVAEQEQPVRRRVALKVIKLGMDTREVIARFEAERQALAMMNHPNIAKVLDAGATDTGQPYFVMELVKGIRITDYCDQHNLPTKERLGLFIQVCHAIQHAHQKGIIHRDIKPPNILVTLHDGVPVPKVIDFGIAKAITGQPLTDKTVYTAMDHFMGTPAYMSPEQAELSGLDIDTRSDIYALGVLLYELLTGQTPFDPQRLKKAGLDEIRRIIREEEPPRPSTRISTLTHVEQTALAKRRHSEPPKLVGIIRGDLDWIVMKTLEKDRTRRYETANGLAMDIQRYLNSEPVVARPPSQLYRLQKLARRHKLAFVSVVAVVAALVGGLGLATWQFLEKSGALDRAVAAERSQARLTREAEMARVQEAELRSKAEEQEAAARQSLYFADMHVALRAMEDSNFGRARQVLERHRPKEGEKDLRGWEWGYLWRSCRSDELATLGQHDSRIFSVAFSPNGRAAASGDADGVLKLWDVANRTERTNFAHRGTVYGIAFSPQGNLLVSASGDGKVRLWDLQTLREGEPLPHGAWVKAAIFSPDGRTLATLSGEGRVHLWDLGSRTKKMTIAVGWLGGATLTGAMAYSPDGRRLAVANHNQEIQMFDASSGRTLGSPLRPATHISGLGFSPDGRFLAMGGWRDRWLGVWDITNEQLRNIANGNPSKRVTGHAAWVCAALFSPNGKTLATAGADQVIRLWDTNKWEEITSLKGHDSELAAMAFSPDGLMLLTGSKDHTVKLWSAVPKQQETRRYQLPSEFPSWSLSPDHRTLVAWKGDGTAILADAATGSEKSRYDLHMTNLRYVGVSADRNLLAASDQSGELKLYDVNKHGFVGAFKGKATAACDHLAFSPDGSVLVTKKSGMGVTAWDVSRLQLLWSQEWPDIYTKPAFSTDGRMLAAGASERTVKVWETATGRELAVMQGPEGIVYDVAFAPNGEVLAATGEDGFVELFDLITWKKTARWRAGLLRLDFVTFSPDGRRLAVGELARRKIGLWDVSTRQEALDYRSNVEGLLTTGFFVDDQTFVAYGGGSFLKYTAATITEADAGGN